MNKGLFDTRTVVKDDFIRFFKIFKKDLIPDSDISDVYFYIGKKLSPLQYPSQPSASDTLGLSRGKESKGKFSASLGRPKTQETKGLT